MKAVGQDIAESLGRAALSEDETNRTLCSLGLQPGDIFSVGSAEDRRFFELAMEMPRGGAH
jgi:hypothetical protein